MAPVKNNSSFWPCRILYLLSFLFALSFLYEGSPTATGFSPDSFVQTGHSENLTAISPSGTALPDYNISIEDQKLNFYLTRDLNSDILNSTALAGVILKSEQILFYNLKPKLLSTFLIPGFFSCGSEDLLFS